jgi:FixJ family two-component response regulator
MSETQFSVFLVDDESRILRTLTRILEANAYSVFAFSSARQFLAEHDHTLPGCAVVDFEMPEIGGLQLMQGLASRGNDRPFIFSSDVNDVLAVVRGMKAGAIDFLPKPINPADLLLAVEAANEKDV